MNLLGANLAAGALRSLNSTGSACCALCLALNLVSLRCGLPSGLPPLALPRGRRALAGGSSREVSDTSICAELSAKLRWELWAQHELGAKHASASPGKSTQIRHK